MVLVISSRRLAISVPQEFGALDPIHRRRPNVVKSYNGDCTMSSDLMSDLCLLLSSRADLSPRPIQPLQSERWATRVGD